MSSEKQKPAKLPAIKCSSRKQSRLRDPKLTFCVWVPWDVPSYNVTKHAHWTVSVSHGKTARLRWSQSLLSSGLDTKSLTMITSLLAANPCETQSPQPSESMTGI